MMSLTGNEPPAGEFFSQGGDITDKIEKRMRYLNRSADMICRSAYGLCRKTLVPEKERPPDAKELKDVCAAVKEAIAIAASLEKGSAENAETLRVIMDASAEKMAQ